jgi:threonine/homoserine/homoserine lactone efflux protein
MGFWAAAAFQWVNPKAWIMAMTAMTTYLPENAQAWNVVALALVASLFPMLAH